MILYIEQSGSIYTNWGWFVSERTAEEIRQYLKTKVGCDSESSVYDCLKDKPLAEIEKYRSEYDRSSGKTVWHPYPDNDFFNADVIHENYTFPTK